METITYSFSNEIKGTTSDVLQGIHLENKNIAIYERDVYHLKDELNEFIKSEIEFRHSGTVQEIEIAIKKDFDSLMSNGNQLYDDIIRMLKLFQSVSKAKSFRLLLATVNTNMCRRFHTDVNDLRLLCTYYGQGTLWLPEEIVNRKALDTCGDNECIVNDESLIQQVATGDIAIIKGAIYPMDSTKACVHRSPTIEESGETRLLLRIDTNEFLNFDWNDTTNI